MKRSNPIWTLVRKDILLEVRQQYSLYGIALYAGATVFVAYLSAGQPDEQTWNSLFWILQLFVCVNAIAKSFLQEDGGRMLYYHSIVSARTFILAKLAYNALLMTIMTAATVALCLLFLGNPLNQLLTFVLVAWLGSVSLGMVFSFVAAIAAKAGQQAALITILGFPLIIPELLLLVKLSRIAFSPVIQQGLGLMFGLLIAFDLLVIVLALILFPFLWKD